MRLQTRRGGRLADQATSGALPSTDGMPCARSPGARLEGPRGDRADGQRRAARCDVWGRGAALRAARASACRARRMRASKAGVARAPCCSTVSWSARASCWRRRRTGTRWRPSRAWPDDGASTACRRRSPTRAPSSAGSARRPRRRRGGAARPDSGAHGRRDPRGALRRPLPLHGLQKIFDAVRARPHRGTVTRTKPLERGKVGRPSAGRTLCRK